MQIVIPGQPISKNRHKCGCAHGRKPFAYDPQIKDEMLGIKAQMQRIYREAIHSLDPQTAQNALNLPNAGSYSVSFRFLFQPSDRGTMGKKGAFLSAKLWGLQKHSQKPDFDNLEKFYCDCMTGIFWKDDAQIYKAQTIKLYDSNPRTEITIMPEENVNLHPKIEGVLQIFTPEKLKCFLKDIKAFQYCHNTLDSLPLIDNDAFKINYINRVLGDLAEFAGKYGTDLKKIEKFKAAKEELEAASLGLDFLSELHAPHN